jgi:CRP-like cAMP-binding protein
MSRHHTPSADRRIAAIDLFAGLSTRQLRRVASLSTPLRRPAGRVIARQGEWMQELIVIVSGTALATAGEGAPVVLGPGDHLGASDGHRGGRHHATVTTTEPTDLLVLSIDDVQALLQDRVIRARLEAAQGPSWPHRLEATTQPNTEPAHSDPTVERATPPELVRSLVRS